MNRWLGTETLLLRLLSLASAIALGCSTQTASPAPSPVAAGCAREPAPWVDAGALPCLESLDAFCAQAPSCPPASFAAALAEQRDAGWPPAVYRCNAYDYVDDGWACGGTTSVLFAYDEATGTLVGAVELSSSSASQQICVGGAGSLERLGSCAPPDASVADAPSGS